MPNRLLLTAAELPLVRRLVVANSLTRSVVRRFVAGETLQDGIAAAAALAGQGTLAILDYLGELVATQEQAEAAASLYLDALARIGEEGLDAHVAVKLTQLGLDLSEAATAGRVDRLAGAAAAAESTVAIDMESHEHTDRTIAVYVGVRASHANVVLCLQAYLRRTAADVEALLPLAPSLRICKGAYREPKDLVFDPGETRRSFVSLLEATLGVCPFVAVATHDEGLVDEALRIVAGRGLGRDRFEFQMLYGVRRELQARLVAQGWRVRAYIPFGDQWYPYLMRRLAERPANLRLFVEALLRG
ncbi:MAG: proline dehydrogenase family protein [Actinomycetota bacterium]